MAESGTISLSGSKIYTVGSYMKIVDLLCVCPVAAATFNKPIPAAAFNLIQGWECKHVIVDTTGATTQPTVNSDLDINYNDGVGDLLGAQLDNVVDANAVNWVELTNSLPMVKEFFIELANNVVNNADFTIRLVCRPARV